MVGKRVQAAGDARDRQRFRGVLSGDTAVHLFSLVATFLVGGYGLFYFLSKTDQGGLITLLAAIAWCVLFAWLWVTTLPPDE
jgi:hypothetical protein